MVFGLDGNRTQGCLIEGKGVLLPFDLQVDEPLRILISYTPPITNMEPEMSP